jgi:methylmalonyl-CoA mutase
MKNLFSEFRDISFKEWKNKANYDLNGKEFNESLNWHGLEGINVPPYFSPDQKIKSINHNRPPKSKTSIAKYFILRNDTRSINIFKSFVKDEFDTIKLFIPKNFDLSQITSLQGLLNKNIQFEFELFTENYIANIVEIANKIESDCKIYLNLDFIGRLPIEGNWIESEKQDFDLLLKVSKLNDNIIPYSINSTFYQNSGANILQQIAYSLATAVEYAEIIGSDFFAKVQYNFAIGSNFFFEIAKLSTFDYLIDLIKQKYNVNSRNNICCESSFRNKTIYDAHSNILRSTTEAMSAMIANTDTFISSSFDSTYNNANNFSSRIGYNQLLILSEEAHIEKVENIDEGSYYVDFIKHELAEKSLEIFKLIENGGGILKQLKEGIIQRKVNDSSKKEQKQFDRNPNSRISSEENMDASIRKYPFLKFKNRKTTFRLIYPRRLSEEIEKKRLNKEKHNS